MHVEFICIHVDRIDYIRNGSLFILCHVLDIEASKKFNL